MARLAPDLVAVLSRHLSDTNAQLVFDRAVARLRLSGTRLNDDDRRRLVIEIERAAQLFVDPARLALLRTDLAVARPSAVRVDPFFVEITGERDISIARVQARQMCEQLGAPPLVMQKLATVVSELARNIVEYTPGGRIDVIPGEPPKPRVLVRATDRGSGIAALDTIMSGRYVSKTGLGVGLIGSKRLVDRFDVKTGPTGTQIEAEVSW